MKKRILRVLLPAFFAILLLTSASDAAEAPIRAVVFFEEDASPAAVEAALAELPEAQRNETLDRFRGCPSSGGTAACFPARRWRRGRQGCRLWKPWRAWPG